MKKFLTGKKHLDITHTEDIKVCTERLALNARNADKRLLQGTDGYYVTKKKTKIIAKEYNKRYTTIIKETHKVNEEFVQCYHCQLYGHLAGNCPKKMKFSIKKLFDKEGQALVDLIFEKKRFPIKILKIMIKKADESCKVRAIKKMFKKFNGSTEGLNLINKRWDEVDEAEWSKTKFETKIKELDGMYDVVKKIKQDREKKLVLDNKLITTPVQFRKQDYKLVKAAAQLELDKKNFEIAKDVLDEEDREYVKKNIEERQLASYLNFATLGVLSDCTDKSKCSKCGFNCEGTCQTPESIVAPYKEKKWYTNSRGKEYFKIEEKPALQSFKRLLTTEKIPSYFSSYGYSYLVQDDTTNQLALRMNYD